MIVLLTAVCNVTVVPTLWAKKKIEEDIEISKNIIELINAFKKKFIKFFFSVVPFNSRLIGYNMYDLWTAWGQSIIKTILRNLRL